MSIAHKPKGSKYLEVLNLIAIKISPSRFITKYPIFVVLKTAAAIAPPSSEFNLNYVPVGSTFQEIERLVYQGNEGYVCAVHNIPPQPLFKVYLI